MQNLILHEKLPPHELRWVKQLAVFAFGIPNIIQHCVKKTLAMLITEWRTANLHIFRTLSCTVLADSP